MSEPNDGGHTVALDQGEEKESRATHSVCLACGKIKPDEYFAEGSTRCRKCIDKGISDQYRPLDGGFELTEVSVDSWPDDKTAEDCHQANRGAEK